MKFVNRREVERLRIMYPLGTRIVLDEMDDPYEKIPTGTQGTVTGVDDAGNIQCRWDTGSSLAVAWGADRVHVVSSEAEVKESLNWLGRCQRRDISRSGFCPRCGAELRTLRRHALSRRANVTICDTCGVAEALEDAGLKPRLSLRQWNCVGNWET